MVDEVSWTAADVRRVLRAPTPTDDKYSRGVVGMRTGSAPYPGAAVLGVEAAWRTGVGMVRYVGPARDLVLARRPETVTVAGRVQSWVVGSGMDAAADPDGIAEVRGILNSGEPVVIDAGALVLATEARGPAVLTPHDREHERLRAAIGLGPTGDDRAAAAAETAAALGATVLLKGSTTFVAAPSGPVLRVDAPTSWLATAGTGDVLAGALGALIAGAAADGRVTDASSLAAPAASAAWLHGRAAALAATALGPAGGPITALDVAEALPRAVAEVLAGG